MTDDCQPNLGCATTEELLQEIKARAQLCYYLRTQYPKEMFDMLSFASHLLWDLPDSILNYRTVDY